MEFTKEFKLLKELEISQSKLKKELADIHKHIEQSKKILIQIEKEKRQTISINQFFGCMKYIS
jgi:hypothetical protein